MVGELSKSGLRCTRRRVVRVAVSIAVLALIAISPPAAASPSNLASTRGLTSMQDTSKTAGGLAVYPINGATYGVDTPIRLLTFFGSQYSLKIALANNAVDGGEQTPSSMCQKTPGCVAAINGDFFDVTDVHDVDPGDEVGGIIRNCVLLHTPEVAHEQANLDAQTVSDALNWTSTIDANGTSMPVTGINQELPMSYLNVHVPLSGTQLFTSPYALTTPIAHDRTTYEFVQVSGTQSPTTINSTTQLKLVGETNKAVRVTAHHVDVSAPQGNALASLSLGSIVSLTTTSSAGCNSIGGHPILLDDGVVGPINRADMYMAEPYARTVIGWTGSGETIIMSVAGVDGKSGATMYQLVSLLLSLDVETALSLDGGGSTTLFANGRVLYPTKTAQRPVSTALLVVQSP